MLTDKEKEGFPITALRKKTLLQQLKNENVVNLIEICTSKRMCPYLHCNLIFLIIFYGFIGNAQISTKVNLI